jgi:hypothetical protein
MHSRSLQPPDQTEKHTAKLEMAHVLFIDMVGYSKLPMDHQEAVSRTLQAVVSATPDFSRAQAGQEMIRLPTGDGMAQAAIKNPGSCHRGPVRIPAGEIENLVCSKLRSFLESPHEVVQALALQGGKVAATQRILGAAREWSKRFASALAPEGRPFIRSLISRIIVHTDSVDVLLDKQALRSALLDGGRPPTRRANQHKGLFRLKVKAELRRCGGEVRLVLPTNLAGEIPVHPAQSLIKAVAPAHDWYARIVRDELTGCRSIAHTTGLDERYVSRIFQCAFLAPDIVESILDGRQPAKLALENFRTHMPIEWAAQRQLLRFSAK